MGGIWYPDLCHLNGTEVGKLKTDGSVKDIYTNIYEDREGKKIKYDVVKVFFHGPFNSIRRLRRFTQIIQTEQKGLAQRRKEKQWENPASFTYAKK